MRGPKGTSSIPSCKSNEFSLAIQSQKLTLGQWLGTGAGDIGIFPRRGFPKLLHPTKHGETPSVLTLSHVEQVGADSRGDEGGWQLLQVPPQGLGQRLGIEQVHVHSRGVCKKPRGSPESTAHPLAFHPSSGRGGISLPVPCCPPCSWCHRSCPIATSFGVGVPRVTVWTTPGTGILQHSSSSTHPPALILPSTTTPKKYAPPGGHKHNTPAIPKHHECTQSAIASPSPKSQMPSRRRGCCGVEQRGKAREEG